MDASTCNVILSKGNADTVDMESAINFYFDNYDLVNKLYPNLKASIKANNKVYKQVIDTFGTRKVHANARKQTVPNESQIIKDFNIKNPSGYTVNTSNIKNSLEAETIRRETEGFLGNSSINMTDQDNFSLPDMGDYYIGNIDNTILEKIDKAYRGYEDAHKAIGYASTAPQKQLGYDEEAGTYFLKASIDLTEDDILSGFMGSTFLTISTDQLSAGSYEDGLKDFKSLIASRTAGVNLIYGSPAATTFELKILGISAPEVPRWCIERNVPFNEIVLVTKQYEEIKDDSKYITIKDSGEIQFVKIGNTYHEYEYLSTDSNSDPTSQGPAISKVFRWLLSSGTKGTDTSSKENQYSNYAAALSAAQQLLKRINEANNEIYIKFESCGLSSSSSSFPVSVGTVSDETATLLNTWASHAGDYLLYTGFNRIHTENTRRFLGEVYVKTSSDYGELFVNLAKLIANDDSLNLEGVSSSTLYEGNNSFAFDVAGYNINDRWYADAFFETLDELDDRKEIQKKVTGRNWDHLKTWNVTIGDCTFFVPPINIRLQTKTRNTRLSLLRSKGSAVKTGNCIDRILAMDIFFNEDRGINGIAYTAELRDSNKTKITYSLNGLRALVAQFRFTPFLPITNDYINRHLMIDAVVVKGLTVQSVPGFPKLIHATLTVQEFDWRVYMPDICQLADSWQGINENIDLTLPDDRTEDQQMVEEVAGAVKDPECLTVEEQIKTILSAEYRNWFATSINWETFRYYYQRPIRRGDFLKTLGWSFNSQNFIQATCGGLTSYMPMEFNDPSIHFYMANEDYMKQLLEKRQMMYQNGGAATTDLDFSENQLKLLHGMSEFYSALQTVLNSKEYQEAIKDLNDYIESHDVKFSNVADSMNNNMGVGTRYWINNTGIINVMGAGEEFRQRIDRVIDVIQTGTANSRTAGVFSPTHQYISNISKGLHKITFGLALTISPELMSITDTDQFKRNVKEFIGYDPSQETTNWPGPFDSLFGAEDNKVVIPVSVSIKNELSGAYYQDSTLYYTIPKTNVFSIAEDTPGMQLLKLSGYIYEHYKDNPVDKAPAVADLMNLKYDQYKIDGVLVTSWSASMTNRTADIRSINSGICAPQYLGGEDVVIDVNITTTDGVAVAMLTAIPDQLTRLTRTYHTVIPCVPLRVDSEFTKFLGVHEVTCEEAYVETEEEYPGVYNVRMRFISMDRTIREKETALRMAARNEGYYLTDNTDISDYGKAELGGAALGAIAGSISGGFAASAFELGVSWSGLGAVMAGAAIGATAFAIGGGLIYGAYSYFTGYNKSFGSGIENRQKYRHYFELKEALGAVDLYPDLELPTLVEMSAVGYHFTRYAFQDERVFVDPDFYFVYPVKLTSAMYREMAIRGMEAGIADTQIVDARGAAISIQPAKFTGYQIVAENDKYKEQRETMNRVQAAVHDLKYHTIRDGPRNNLARYDAIKRPLLSFLNLTMDKKTWDICEKIKVMFLESKFKQEIESYIARTKADSIGNTGGMTQTFTEGKYAYDKLQPVVSEADKMYDILKTTSIEDMFPKIAGDADKFYSNFTKLSSEQILGQITPAVKAFLGDKSVLSFFNLLCIDVTNDFKDLFVSIVKAACCAASSKKEYSAKRFSSDWQPYADYIGVKMGGVQNANQTTEVWWTDPVKNRKELYNTVVKCGIKFGCFNIVMYTHDGLQRIAADWEKIEEKSKDEQPEPGNINFSLYLLDPYYRDASVDTIEQYKGKCITSVAYCTYAYCRLIIYWLIRMVKDYVFPNISVDYFRGLSRIERDIEGTTDQYLGKGSGAVTIQPSDGILKTLQQYINFYNDHTYVMDSGKIWAAAVMAGSENDLSIYYSIRERDYDGLNAIIDSCISPITRYNEEQNRGKMIIRKMALALVGLGIIEDMKTFGISQTNPTTVTSRETFQKRYIEAAEDPKQFIPHSYHDMIVYDARGRMLRAFPTFYMTFIDEGREIGFWKLHDNFYSNSAITSIEVVKSRRLPADVCTIQMSNFYNSFATEQEDYIKTPIASFDDAWNSLFSAREYFESQEVARSNKPQEIRLRLRPGARIHVRMGYGNNVNMLPILFNGVIAEVSSEDMVTIVAQGDGIELCNPIGIDKESQNLDAMSDFFDSVDNGITPLQAASSLFTSYAGVFSEAIRKRLKMNLVSRNAFGIVHFGDPDFTTFCKSGETCHNLYEVSEEVVNGYTGDITHPGYATGKLEFSCDMFQKTPWDILNICKSLSPDFRLAVLPFGFRSTCFMGKPHYYYCYDYIKDEEGVVQEKRKPFQQWHIYTSEQDIIGNGIAATTRDVKTVATGMFQVYDIANTRTQKTVGPLYADWDIYNECQKTMIVDTSLLGKGIPYIQGFTNILGSRNWFDKLFPETGPFVSHHKIAWRATASALRESVQDMYAGDLVLFGDPSVKPQDRMYIADKYTMISGQALVKETVHRLSVDGGFTTTVSPDCIVTVNDNTELIKYFNLERVGSLGAIATSTVYEKAVSQNVMPDFLKHVLVGGAAGGVISLAGYKLLGGKLTSLLSEHGTLREIGNKISFKITDALKKIAQSNTKGILKSAAKYGLSGLLYLGKNTTVGRIAVAVTTVASMLFSVDIGTEIAEFIRNFKVLKIYPLKKFGYCLTAGFEGARGTVYGSPTWGDRGTLGDIFDEFPALTEAFLFLTGDEINDLAKQYLKDNNVINEQGEPATAETQYGKTAAFLSGNTFAYHANNYRSMQITPRAVNSNAKDVLNAYNHFKVMDINHYKEDPHFKLLRLISQDSRIIPYIDEQFFVIAHEDPGLPIGTNVIEDILTIGGKEYRTKVIATKDDKGNTVLDIPVLHPDALNILYEILRRTKLYMPSANSTDKQEGFESSKTDYLVLKGALRVGDQGSLAAAGFTFTLTGTSENSQRALKASIEDLDKEFKDPTASALGMNQEIFKYFQQINHEVVFIVNMPQVSDTD